MPITFRLTAILMALLVSACATTQNDTNKDAWSTAPQINQHPGSESEDKVYVDVWDRVRDGFRLPELDSPVTDHYVEWYTKRPEYMERMIDRASIYLFYIVEELEAHDFPMEIALLPAIESAYRPTAYSHAHASGLWQFISATGRRYGLKQNWWYDGRRDVVGATNAAIQYLSFLRDEFDGDWFHALAAYNGGERRVQRAIISNRSHGKPTDYQHLDLRRETERYVPKLLAVKRIVQNPGRYGITLKTVPNRPYFEIVETGSQVDLTIIAESAGISASELRDLNPGFRRWATDPSGPHRVLIPVAAADRVRTKLASLPENKRMRWASYTVRRGDTLGAISRHYGVSVNALQTTNRLRGTMIRAGQTLVVPMSTRSVASSASPSSTPTATRSGDDARWTTYQVRRGDTLSEIARSHGTSIGALKANNRLRGSFLRAGQTIKVPPRAVSVSSAQSVVHVHQVKRGDTLWGIARRYKVNVRELQHWNELAAQDVLRLGQKIMVYLN